MLRELHIQNLAVIEQASIEFAPGLNVFTGQTGAGKSLVLGALESLLGLRKSAAKMVRPGTEQARVSGVFEIPDTHSAEEAGLALDLDLLPGDELLLTRKIFASGRSSISANGQPVTAAMVRRAAECMIDIHGQHDHQLLMRPGNQLALIDAYAGTTEMQQAFGERWRALVHMKEERDRLSESQALRTQQLDLYHYQADEIDAAEPMPREMIELQARERLLGNLRRIKKDAGAAYSALYDSEGSIAERLQALTHVLIDLADLDDSVSPIAEQVRTATLTLQESAFELSRYTDRLDLDPAELSEIESRLDVLNRLIQKYGDGRSTAGQDDPLAAVLSHRAFLSEQISLLERESQGHEAIDQQIAETEQSLSELGQTLSEKRRPAAEKIGPKVCRQLKELGMRDATLRVIVEPNPIDSPSVSANGIDRVEIMARTNPGQDERPLREIASGGELSRVMLGIKSVFAAKRGLRNAATGVDVLVFDEIDANIGGRLGDVIGRKLHQLGGVGKKSEQPQRQVLCITHLPQIAAFADRHFHIIKQVRGSGKTRRTDTTVVQLDGDERINELAEMLAGSRASTTSREQAKELLAATR